MRLAFAWKTSWFLAALLLLSACGRGTSGPRDGDDTADGGAPSMPVAQHTRSLPECPDTKYTPCDIREADCQTWLASIAACMRGSEPLGNLQIDVMSEDEYVQLELQDLASYEQPKYFHTGKARSLLGLTPEVGFGFKTTLDLEGYAKDQATKLGGVYRDAEKRVIIVDHGRPDDDPGTNIVLVHEFIHALQDVDYDIETWEKDGAAWTFDHGLALVSVVEGEAEFYENRVSYPMFGYDIQRYDVGSGLIREMHDLAQHDIDDDSPYDGARLTFPYGFGALLSFYAYQQDGNGPAGIAKLWSSPPQNTQALMSRVLYIDDPQPSAVDVPEPDVPELDLFSQDALGAWGIMLIMSKQGASWNEATTAALSWRGDQLWVYTDASNLPTYALWEIELGSETAATQIDETLAKLSDAARYAFEHGASGKRVFASVAFNDAPDQALTDAAKAWLSGN